MAAPVDAGSIYSDVRIRLDKLNADIKAVSTGFDKLGKKLRVNSDKTTKTQTENFKKVGLAGVAAIGAITLAFKKSVSVFAETEQSLANVEAVSNATAAEFRELKKAAEDAGTTTRFTAGQAADALFFLSSAGLSATESVKALDGVLQLAGATGSDLASTARAVTSTLSQFSLASEKSADIANVFAAANSNSQATLEKLAGSLRQVGPVAAGLGIGLEEVVGSLQALFNAGFQGEAAGRALKSALADLANEASPTIEKLEALGVSFDSVNPEAVGLTEAIGALEDASLSTGQVMDAFGKVAGPQLLTLINTGKSAIEDYTDAVTGTNEAARQYAVQNNTLSGSIDALKSAVEGTSNSFIEELSPALRFIIDLFANILRIVNKLPSILKGAGVGAGVAAGGFIVLSKALALIGVTLSTGPLGIIVAIGALVIGLNSLAQEIHKVRDAKLAEEFGDLARELGFAGQAVEEFSKSAGSIESAFVLFEGMPRTAREITKEIERMTEAFGLTKDEIIDIALQSDRVSEKTKDQLETLRKQAQEQRIIKELNSLSDLRSEQALVREDRRLEKLREQARIDQEKQIREQEEINRSERLLEIKEQVNLLDKLALKGALSERDALEEKKALREEEISLLLEQALASGEITDQVIADIALQQAAVDRYSERLEFLDSQSEENLEKEKKRAEENAKAWDGLSKRREDRNAEMLIKIGEDAEEAEKKREEDREKEIQGYIDMYSSISNAAVGLFSSLVALSSSLANAQIADINRVLEAQQGAIDQEAQDLLESLGIQEETKLESLEKQLEAAIAAGDSETAEELRQEIARTEILEAAEADKQLLREQADTEIRALQRTQAERERALRSFSAGIDTSAAIIRFLADPGGIPGIVLSIAAGVTGLAQIAAINAAPLPALQTGGIILPKPGGTAAILAENGSPELALNAGSEGESLLGQFADKIATRIGASANGVMNIVLELDGRPIAQSTVNFINNGNVRLTTK